MTGLSGPGRDSYFSFKLYFVKNVNWIDSCKKIRILTDKHLASQKTQAVNNQQREKSRESSNKHGSLCLHTAKSRALRLTRRANARPAQGRSQKSLQSGSRETLFCADCIVCRLCSVNLMCEHALGHLDFGCHSAQHKHIPTQKYTK